MSVGRLVCITGFMFFFHSLYCQENFEQLYRGLATMYDSGRYEVASVSADNLLNGAIASNDSEMEVRALTILGLCRQRLGMPAEETVPMLEKVLKNLNHADPKYLAETYWALAVSYPKSADYNQTHNLNHFQSSDSLLHLAQELFENEGNIDGVIRVYHGLAVVKTYDENEVESMRYLKKAYELALVHGYSGFTSLVNNIALNYISANQSAEAITMLNQVLEAFGPEITWKHSYVFNAIGNAYTDLKEWDKAAKSFERAIAAVTDDRAKAVKMWSYEEIAYCYLQMKKYDTLQFWIDQSESYFDQDKVSSGSTRHSNYMNLYRGYLELEKGNFEKSLNYADLHLEQAEKDGWDRRYSENNKLRYEIYRRWGKHEDALSFYEKYVVYEDSVSNSKLSKIIDDYKIMLATAEQRADILQLEKDVQARNLRIWVISVGFTLSLIAAFFVIKYYRIKKIKVQQELSRKQQQLADHTVAMLKKNQAIAELDELISDANKKNNGELVKSIQRMERVLAFNRNEEENWNQFLEYFGAIHSDFFTKLKRKYKDLSSNDLRHCALIKMNMSLKEAGDIFGVEANSVKVARYRIKKKMNIDEEESIFNAIANI